MQALQAPLRLLTAFIALSFVPLAVAQSPEPLPQSLLSIHASYAAEPIVIQRSDTVVTMAAYGTGLRLRTFAARLNSDEAVKKYSVLAIPYAGSSQHVEIVYARVLHSNGSVVDTAPSDAMDMPAAVTRAAPFYSDLKELQLPIRSLHTGDTIEFQYRIVRTKPETPGQFWGQESFGETAVALSETFELRLPASIYANVWSPTLKPTESDLPATASTPAQHVYRWVTSQLKPTVGAEAEAAAAAKKKVLWTPEQEIDAEQGKLPTIAWTTFHSWAEIGAWYRSLESDRIIPDAAVKAKADELIRGKTTDEAKAHALYDYVATQIRYIGVAFGIGRYQPHTAAEILSNQYGDCKDKHTLLAAMLAAEGIQSDAVLIGAHIRFNPEVPSPSAFNHLITHLTLDGKPVWLDSTAEVAPFGMLALATRDKDALVVPPSPSTVASILHTPAEPAIAGVINMTAAGALDADGVSTSHIVLTFRGDGELAVRAVFRLLPPDKYDQAVQLFSKAIGFTGTTSNPEVSRPTDTTQPFRLTFDYKREKAGDWSHLRTLPELVPAVLPQVTDIDPPVHAIQLGSPRTEVSTSSMKLPAGWTAIPPPAVHAKCAYATYDMTYRFENGTLYADRRIQVLAKKVPVSDWRSYKAFVDLVNPGKERYIQLLTATGRNGIGQSPTTGASVNPEQRTKQIEDALASTDPNLKSSVAFALARNNDHLSDAQTLAEQAVKIREQITSQAVSMQDKTKFFDQMQSLGADWETLGWVYYHSHLPEKAEIYMHAAWELKPRNADINLFMGLIYEAEHRPEDATTFYRMALSATNSPAVHNLIQSRFDRLGSAATSPLPTDPTTPLPSLALALNTSDPTPVVDILLTRDHPPLVALITGDPALEAPLSKAIQAALAHPFPDDGPEKLLRRARVTCSADATPTCELHFLGSQVAMQESYNSRLNSGQR